MIELTYNPIHAEELTSRVRTPSCGAVITFLGTVRDFTGEHYTQSLEYHAYIPLAEKEMLRIEQEIRKKWVIGDVVLIHRLGELAIGEISVAIAVSSPHRDEAFAACRFAIDEIKRTVPIWKKETGKDGQKQWIDQPDNTNNESQEKLGAFGAE